MKTSFVYGIFWDYMISTGSFMKELALSLKFSISTSLTNDLLISLSYLLIFFMALYFYRLPASSGMSDSSYSSIMAAYNKVI